MISKRTQPPNAAIILDPLKRDADGKLKERLVHKLKFVAIPIKEGNKVVIKELAQMLVIGKRHDWKHWIPLDAFVEANPGVMASV